MRTDAAYAPWNVVPSTDRRYTHVVVLETILGRLESLL